MTIHNEILPNYGVTELSLWTSVFKSGVMDYINIVATEGHATVTRSRSNVAFQKVRSRSNVAFQKVILIVWHNEEEMLKAIMLYPEELNRTHPVGSERYHAIM